uniref:Zinc finger protein 654 n=1 Tax=Callorhinchus milii TaxID=7868 RepID=A0A4W3JU48_CALMI
VQRTSFIIHFSFSKQVTEWYAGTWQVPLPLLQVLKNAICSFTKARPLLAAECEHIQYVLSRLALSCFEVLLYFTDDEQSKEYWEDFLKSIQECHNVLQSDINAEFDVLIKMSKNGGPWQNPVLQSIVNQKSVTQESVTEYLSSESPVFLEYRVKYLMKYEHITEAMTLTKYCVNHPQIGENKYFLHLFLSWLCRSSPEEVLLQEIARIDCKEALDVICRLDSEEQVELSWILCVAFLTQQLRNGDVYCTRELILVWSKLQLKIDSSKQHFLEKCHHLLLTSKNVNHIFLFIRIGVEGLQFCVELCARALRMDYQDEPNTKTLVCKTLSYLLPNDLDFCRACTLTVFFFERTLESFNAVENLYSQPDELRTEDENSVPSFLRCELLLVLKTTWHFDPEFWDWRILKKNCLALMSGKLTPPQSSEDGLVVKDLNCTEANGKTKSRTKEKLCKKLQPSQGISKADGHITPMHRCVLCKKEFLGGHIVRHAQVHQQRGAFTCLICARKFRLKGQMLKHLKTHVMKVRKQELAAHTDTQKESCNVTDGLQEACTHINGILDGGNENKNALPVSASGDEEIDCKKLTGDEADRGSVGDEVQQDSSAFKGKAADVLGNEGSLSCPGHGCSKVFTKIQFLTKHARKVHSADENVQDYLMKWYKGKCRYCQRKFMYSQHLIDHLKKHVYPKLYFCLQYSCNQRFKSASELLTHTKGHEVFQAQCSFRDCDKVFDKLDVLYEHEAQHYISRKPICFADCDKRNFQANNEASPKLKANDDKRLISEQNPVELLVPSWKSRKDFSEPKTYLHSMVSKQSANGTLSDPSPVSIELDQKSSTVESDSTNCGINNEQIVNGHSELKEPSCDSNTDSFYSGAQPKYCRPQPPSYLDERYISMPKRRKLSTDSSHPPSSQENTVNMNTERHICRKCFMIFNSTEALERHNSLKNCRPLFVMESDGDESKCHD